MKNQCSAVACVIAGLWLYCAVPAHAQRDLGNHRRSIGQTLQTRTVSELPLGGQRRFAFLTTLSPSVVPNEPGTRDAAGGSFSADGVVNVTLKSGANDFHGMAHWTLQNDKLGANRWERNDRRFTLRPWRSEILRPGASSSGCSRVGGWFVY